MLVLQTISLLLKAVMHERRVGNIGFTGIYLQVAAQGEKLDWVLNRGVGRHSSWLSSGK